MAASETAWPLPPKATGFDARTAQKDIDWRALADASRAWRASWDEEEQRLAKEQRAAEQAAASHARHHGTFQPHERALARKQRSHVNLLSCFGLLSKADRTTDDVVQAWDDGFGKRSTETGRRTRASSRASRRQNATPTSNFGDVSPMDLRGYVLRGKSAELLGLVPVRTEQAGDDLQTPSLGRSGSQSTHEVARKVLLPDENDSLHGSMTGSSVSVPRSQRHEGALTTARKRRRTMRITGVDMSPRSAPEGWNPDDQKRSPPIELGLENLPKRTSSLHPDLDTSQKQEQDVPVPQVLKSYGSPKFDSPHADDWFDDSSIDDAMSIKEICDGPQPQEERSSRSKRADPEHDNANGADSPGMRSDLMSTFAWMNLQRDAEDELDEELRLAERAEMVAANGAPPTAVTHAIPIADAGKGSEAAKPSEGSRNTDIGGITDDGRPPRERRVSNSAMKLRHKLSARLTDEERQELVRLASSRPATPPPANISPPLEDSPTLRPFPDPPSRAIPPPVPKPAVPLPTSAPSLVDFENFPESVEPTPLLLDDDAAAAPKEHHRISTHLHDKLWPLPPDVLPEPPAAPSDRPSSAPPHRFAHDGVTDPDRGAPTNGTAKRGEREPSVDAASGRLSRPENFSKMIGVAMTRTDGMAVEARPSSAGRAGGSARPSRAGRGGVAAPGSAARLSVMGRPGSAGGLGGAAGPGNAARLSVVGRPGSAGRLGPAAPESAARLSVVGRPGSAGRVEGGPVPPVGHIGLFPFVFRTIA